ncbi:MAG: 50S ribosomal protein L22 [Gemmatimonadetes bacterium]|nr:50S ribosomal protein L22 [Gemmatimonadota bacterium]|tara:strand:+ start:491 stop:841 length:351 start_codon:yes stop_codon:yes gene_type:complete
MEAKAIARMVRMSPRKVRLVVDQIRGKLVNEAYAILKFSNKFAAEPVGKTLRSAVANAQNKAEGADEVLDLDELRVETAFVDEGPTYKRWRASAMGRGSPRRRRTSHITVIVNTED